MLVCCNFSEANSHKNHLLIAAQYGIASRIIRMICKTSPTYFCFVQADREYRDNVSVLPCSPRKSNADLEKYNSINWVELKTSAAIANDKDVLKYERKLLKFWIQSFLLGVPRIVVGFRSQNGILQKLEELETQNIPGIVRRRGNGTWDGNLCINFTAAFLDC